MLTGTALAVGVTSGIGSLASRTRRLDWYARLRKPAYVPPTYVFPVAWTALYGDIAVTSAAAIDRLNANGRKAQSRALIAALGTNLILNASWSWLFFRNHHLGVSAAAAAALAVSSADLALRVADGTRGAGLALAPYPLWCAFATIMATHIWRLNRKPRSSGALTTRLSGGFRGH